MELKAHIAIFKGPTECKSYLLSPPVQPPQWDAKVPGYQRLQLIVQPLAPIELPVLASKLSLAEYG